MIVKCLKCAQMNIAANVAYCPNCGVDLKVILRDVLAPGTTLQNGKYEIEYAIGRGGFGITYRAKQSGYLSRPRAVKEFYPKEMVDRATGTNQISAIVRDNAQSFQRWKDKFIREAQMLERLQHPGIVRVTDCFAENGTAYFVMDYLEGHSLLDEMRAAGGKLSEARVQEVLEQTVSALAEAHQEGIYHLDLSPDNVMLNHRGRAVLVDFGAARLAGNSLSKGYTSTVAFKEQYAPLEVRSGKPVGPESDIFELGMMLHELLTGELPPSAFERASNLLEKQDDWKPIQLRGRWIGLVQSATILTQQARREKLKSITKWWSDFSENEMLEVMQLMSQVVAAVERGMTVAGRGSSFPTALRAGLLAVTERYPFLDPFAAEFEYQDKEIVFVGTAQATEFASGVTEAMRQMVEDLIYSSNRRVSDYIAKELLKVEREEAVRIHNFGLGSLSAYICQYGMPDLMELMSKVVAAVESGMAVAGRDRSFPTALRAGLLAVTEHYPFLDPFAAEFEYEDKKIVFVGTVQAQEFASGLTEALRVMVEDLTYSSNGRVRDCIARELLKVEREEAVRIHNFDLGNLSAYICQY